jgi:hypothetical protein
MDRVEQVLPSVDHLAMRREAPEPESVASALGEQGSSGVVEPFEGWRRLLEDFEAAVAGLTELRNGAQGAERQAEYQETLGGRIDEVRRCRQALEEAAGDVRRRVISEIDSALAHEAARAP